MEIIKLPLAELQQDPANARAHGAKNLEAIVGSLRQFGQCEPLVVQQATKRIIGGHGRYEAMTALGWTHAEVVLVDFDELHARALGLALNRTSELAEWDTARLEKVLHELEADSFALEGIGFSPEDVAKFNFGGGSAPWGEGGEDPEEAALEEPEAGELPKEPTTRPGDVWRLGEHRLVCGDTTQAEIVRLCLQGEVVPLLFTDPPYNQAGAGHTSAAGIRKSYKALADSTWDTGFDFGQAQQSLLSALAPDASCYVCTSQQLAGAIWQWMSEWAAFWGYCVWQKPNPMPSLHKRHWTWCTELLCYGTRGKHTFNFPAEGHALNAWHIAKSRSNDLHPTMKPVEVPAHAMRHSSAAGDLVADFFAGAGSTLLAAEQLGRRARCIEISPAYCDVIVDRWESLTGQKAER